jgi:hypothetical protein
MSKTVVGSFRDIADAQLAHALLAEGMDAIDVDMLPVGAPRAAQGIRPRGLSASFQRHYEERYAAMGASYSNYEPAYRYGASLVWEARDADADWETVEAQARRGWQARHRGSNWEHFKAAVRFGWSQAQRYSVPLPSRS